MKILGAENIVWVGAEIIKSAGLTEFELPLFRPEHGVRSSLTDVSNERARTADLTHNIVKRGEYSYIFLLSFPADALDWRLASEIDACGVVNRG